MIEELAEHRELLFAYVVQSECDFRQGFDLSERPACDRHVVDVFGAVYPTVTLGDIRGNRDGGASNLACQTVGFFARKASGQSIRLERKRDAFCQTTSWR